MRVSAAIASNPRLIRIGRFAAIIITCLLLVVGAWEAEIITRAARSGNTIAVGYDFDLYLGHAERWLAGGGFYLPAQTSGPYQIEVVNGNTYPPVLLYVLLPFALGVPHVLWWLVPIGVTGLAMAASRPAWWAWPIVAIVFVYPRTWNLLVMGNPAMWAIAAAVAGVAWGWPAIGAALKLTFAPLMLVGYGHRGWWPALAIALLLCLPFGAMWLDYVTALVNMRTSWGLDYLLGEWPIAIALVLAAASRRVHAPHLLWARRNVLDQ